MHMHTLISQCALEMAAQGLPVNVVADDTDVATYSLDVSLEAGFCRCLYFLSEAKKAVRYVT